MILIGQKIDNFMHRRDREVVTTSRLPGFSRLYLLIFAKEANAWVPTAGCCQTILLKKKCNKDAEGDMPFEMTVIVNFETNFNIEVQLISPDIIRQ